jgi:spore germination protein (amino acid permease)
VPVRVNVYQAVVIVLLVTIGTVFFPVAGVVTDMAGTSGWMSVAAAFIVALPWAFVAGAIFRLGPSGDWGQAVKAWLGPWLGRLFLLYFAFCWTWLGSYLLAQTGQVFHAVALPRTPPEAMIIATLILVVLTDFRGIEVFTRTTEALFLLSIPFVLGFFVGAVENVRLARLMPLIDTAPIRIAHAGLFCLPWAMEGILFLLFIGAHVKDNKRLGLMGAMSILAAGLSLSIFTALTVGSLGRSVVELYLYPAIALAQTAQVGFFLQGLELFLYPLWLTASYIKVTASFILVSASLRGIVPGVKQPYRTLILSAVFLGIALVPGSIADIVAGVARVDNSFFMAFYLILPLALIWGAIRRRNNSSA